MTEPTPPQKSLPPPPPSPWSAPQPTSGQPPVPAPPPYGSQPYPAPPMYGQQGPPPPGYGYPSHVNQVFVQQYAPTPVVILPTKSVGLSLVLTFFFGPFGMLYTTVAGGIAMFFIEIVVAALTLGLGLFFTWPICMIWGAVAANNYNTRLLAGQGQLLR